MRPPRRLPRRLPRRTARRVAPLAAGIAALALVQPAAPVAVATTEAAAPAAVATAGTPGAARSSAPARPGMRRVVAISVDGLNPAAIARVGRTGAPNLYRLRDQGATTLNARTAVEQTVTLPNHTGMVTSRRIETRAGHGMDVNDDPGGTVAQYAGHPVGSVFSRLRSANRQGALYVSKSKLDILHRSWPRGIARYVVDDSPSGLMTRVRGDLVNRPRPFSFVHLGATDVAGHASGWMSEPYLDAVRRVDRALGELLATIDSRPALRRTTTVLLTSDHGGKGVDHSDATSYANYRIAFMAWGAGVRRGADLYRLNPELANPGRSRPSYAASRQPVRNAAIGNLGLDLLGIGPIPGSGIDTAQRLDLR